MVAIATAQRPRRRITREEYDRMIELGFFVGEKLELLRGELVEMSPIGSRHSWAVTAMYRALDRALGERAFVRSQQPLIAAAQSEPEPDVSIVTTNNPRAHPRHALLVVEIAESSLRDDLGDKAWLYAESEVDEYWVVDLEHDVVHVHREPVVGEWRSVTVHAAGATLTLLAFPDVAIELASIMPAR